MAVNPATTCTCVRALQSLLRVLVSAYVHVVTVNPDNQRERSLVLSQLRELLRLVPYTRPETWVGLKPLEMLPG